MSERSVDSTERRISSIERFRSRWRELTGLLLVVAVRLMTLPRTPWEADEFLFLQAVVDFDPSRYHPHPPGYPLYVFLGKVVNLVVQAPFASLVIVSLISCAIGFLALCRAFERMSGDRDVAVGGALLFYLSAGMLVHSTLALADGAALMFLALTFAASAGEGFRGVPRSSSGSSGSSEAQTPEELRGTRGTRGTVLLGAFASAAIGCRPQLSIALLPALAVLFLLSKRRWTLLAAFTAMSLLWFVPLVVQCGGIQGFLDYELKQAAYFAQHDAGQSRGAMSVAQVAVRFIAHPWGAKWVAGPVMLLAGIGLARRRPHLAFALFCAIHLGFAIATMDPADGVRYSLPGQMLIAFLAANALRRFSLPIAIVLGALSFWYASPILLERAAKPSAPAQAAAYIDGYLPRDAVIVKQPATQTIVDWYFDDRRTIQLEEALRQEIDAPMVLLADGGSTAPDAKVFAWRESDAYGKLTRNVFRNITVDPIRAEERYVPERGVFALERNPRGEEWRWLAPAATLRLPPLGRNAVLIDLRLPADAPWDANEVTINGMTIPVTKGASPRLIPFAPVLELRSAKSYRPADVLKNRDARVVAVQLVRIEQR
ncbi:MAG TPA: hypothetical protein VF111_04695 [Thermoanaerobaculia bacterium]